MTTQILNIMKKCTSVLASDVIKLFMENLNVRKFSTNMIGLFILQNWETEYMLDIVEKLITEEKLLMSKNLTLDLIKNLEVLLLKLPTKFLIFLRKKESKTLLLQKFYNQ